MPAVPGKRLQMPAVYRAGAETGYVEIIAMGRPTDEQQPIALAARHQVPSTAASTVSTPLDCDAVRSNFFADGQSPTRPGVKDNDETWQRANAASANARLKTGGLNTYVHSGNALKVSYFIRDNATGIEFGDNAVHISNFLTRPALTNQQYGVFSGDLNGFDFPDLNGGVPLSSAGGNSIRRARFDALRAPNVLGASAIVNEWSANPANGVAMDWVLTLPGQYTMLRLPQYVASLTGAGRPAAPTVNRAGKKPVANARCPRVSTPAPAPGAAPTPCDYRDMPVEVDFSAYNREAFKTGDDSAPELVTSPAPPGAVKKTYLPKVANVVSFGDNRVLGQSDATISADMGQPYGWVRARVKSVDTQIQVCDWDFADDISRSFGATAGDALKDTLRCSPVTHTGVPVIGFAAWSRRVAANPEASYGRIVEHSYQPLLACAGGGASGAKTIAVSGRVYSGSPLTGATVILKDVSGNRLASAVTDADGRYTIEVAAACIGGAYRLQAFGGKINGADFSGVMSALYAANDSKTDANITPISTLIASLAESYNGSAIEKRNQAIQRAVALGLIRQSDFNRIDAEYVEESVLQALIAERGLNRWISELRADIENGSISSALMDAFPRANGGIRSFRLIPESNIALFPGETKRVGAEFDTSDGEYLLQENGEYSVVGAGGTGASGAGGSQAGNKVSPPSITIDNKPDWISIDKGVLTISPTDSVAKQTYTVVLHAKNKGIAVGKKRTITVEVLDRVLLLSGEIGPAGGRVMNFWKDIILSVEPKQLSQSYRFSYYAGVTEDDRLLFQALTTPEMPIEERLKVEISKPAGEIVKHNYLSDNSSARQSLGVRSKQRGKQATAYGSAGFDAQLYQEGVPRDCKSRWKDLNGDGHRFDYIWDGKKAWFDNDDAALMSRSIRFKPGVRRKFFEPEELCSSALRSSVKWNHSSLTDGNHEPVLLVHGFIRSGKLGGINKDEEYFGATPKAIETLTVSGRKFIPFLFQWRTNARFQDVASELGEAIERINEKTGKQVHIVAHSFGGLLARTLAQGLATDSRFDKDFSESAIASITTVGTPHSGIFKPGVEKTIEFDSKGEITFPNGVDSFAGALIRGCKAITCYQAGESWSVLHRKNSEALYGTRNNGPRISLDPKSLILYKKAPGYIVYKLAKEINNYPNIPTQVLIGIVPADLECIKSGKASCKLSFDIRGKINQPGDKLISLKGQRVKP